MSADGPTSPLGQAPERPIAPPRSASGGVPHGGRDAELRPLLAPVSARRRAAVTDYLAVIVIPFAITVAVDLLLLDSRGLPIEVLGPLLFAAAFLIRPIALSRGGAHNGQTLGMQRQGIRIVRTDGRRVAYGPRHPLAFLEVTFLPHRVLPPYQHDQALAQATGPADVHGPALAVRADVRRLPGAPPPPSGRG